MRNITTRLSSARLGLCVLCLLLTGPALAAWPAAPLLSAPQLDSAQPFALSALRGKVVYVDFWATWCAPCRVSLPLLNALRQSHGAKGFEVVGVNVETDTAAVRRVVQAQGLRYPLLHPVDAAVMQSWAVQDMPTAFLIDRQGRVRKTHRGFLASDFPALQREIETLLEEPAP